MVLFTAAFLQKSSFIEPAEMSVTAKDPSMTYRNVKASIDVHPHFTVSQCTKLYAALLFGRPVVHGSVPGALASKYLNAEALFAAPVGSTRPR